MMVSLTQNERSFVNGNSKNDKPFGFSITSDFIMSYLYGKNTIKPIESKQLLAETAAMGGLQKNCSQQKKTCISELTLPYSIASFPDEVLLCYSSIPGIRYGVCTKKFIPRGTWIGPYEGRQIGPNEVTSDMDTSFLWEIYENGKLVYYINGSDENCSSWMRFIHCARHEQEQNLCVVQYRGNIYYRAFKDIPPGEELLVWYDKNYPQYMGIPLGLDEEHVISRPGPDRKNTNFKRGSHVTAKICEDYLLPDSRTSHLESIYGGVKTKIPVFQSYAQPNDFFGSSVTKNNVQDSIFSPNKSQTQNSSGAISRYSAQPYNLTSNTNPCISVRSGQSADLNSSSNSMSSPSSYNASTPSNSPLEDVYSPKTHVDSPALDMFNPAKLRFNFDQTQIGCSTEPCSPTKPLVSPNLPAVTAQVRHSPIELLASSKVSVTAQSKQNAAKPSTGSDHLSVTELSRYSPTDEINEWKCGHCQKTFTQRVLLQNHVCPKQPDKPYKCGHCAETFANSSDLRIHVVKHTSEKPFKCGFCSRSFAGATTLNNHIRTHTGEKPFGCKRCGLSFSQASHLSRHQRMPGECIPDKTFLTSASTRKRKLSIDF